MPPKFDPSEVKISKLFRVFPFFLVFNVLLVHMTCVTIF